MDTLPIALRPVLDEVQAVAGWLWDRGWAEGNAGNVSVDVTERLAGQDLDALRAAAQGGLVLPCPVHDERLAGRWLLVSAAGSRFRDMAQSPALGMLLAVLTSGAECRVLRGPSARQAVPTSELPAHLLIHAELSGRTPRPKAVLHTHPTNLIAVNHSVIGSSAPQLTRALWGMLPEVKVVVPDGLGLVDYRLPGSIALAQATVAQLRHRRVVVWDKHGVLATASGLTQAFDLVDTLDKAAGIYLRCLAAGYQPRGLSDEELADLDSLTGKAAAT